MNNDILYTLGCWKKRQPRAKKAVNPYGNGIGGGARRIIVTYSI